MDTLTILLLISIGFTFIENILINFGVKWYYESGFIIYSRTGTLPGRVTLPLSEEYIINKIPVSKFVNYKVSTLEENRFAIREKLFGYKSNRYPAIMRGIITVNPFTREIAFTGNLNLSVFAILIFLAAYFMKQFANSTQPDLIIYLVLLIVVAMLFVSYRFQKRRYAGIFEKLLSDWNYIYWVVKIV